MTETTTNHSDYVQGWIDMRENVRMIMRGEDPKNAIATDIVREVVEWAERGKNEKA